MIFNRDKDRGDALARINFAQRHTNGVEFVGICIPDLANGIHANPNPQQPSTHAVAEANQNARPSRAPYIMHWDVNNNTQLIIECNGMSTFCSGVDGVLNSMLYSLSLFKNLLHINFSEIYS